MRNCAYCGDEVGNLDWDEVNGRRVYCCGKPECSRELRDDDRAAYEEAAEALYRDHHGW